MGSKATNLSIKPDRAAPIRIGKFTLTDTGMLVVGRPTFPEYQGVGDFIKRAARSSPWWLADWLAYGETRADWRAILAQAVDVSELSEKTAMNYKYIGENVHPSRRRGDVDFSLHAEVAPLSPKQQTYFLDQAASEGWSRNELRQEIMAAKRRRVIDGQARLQGMFRVIYADPPWRYSDAMTSTIGQAHHYEGMTVEQLAALPIAAHALPNAVLFCWVTAAMLYETPGPREVITAWGFVPKTQRIWHKVRGNWGHYVSVQHELLIIATRGSGLPDRPTPLLDSVVTERATGEHSEKPARFRRDIERLYDGPYLELFGRTPVLGWSVFGNDARLWAQEAEAATV